MSRICSQQFFFELFADVVRLLLPCILGWENMYDLDVRSRMGKEIIYSLLMSLLSRLNPRNWIPPGQTSPITPISKGNQKSVQNDTVTQDSPRNAISS